MEILRDRRPYRLLGGGEEVHQVRTWREAHQVLVEYEQLGEGTQALVAALGPERTSQEGGGGRKRHRDNNGAQGKGVAGGSDPPDVAAFGNQDERSGSMPGHLRKVCWYKRDQGKCDRPDCSFDHDDRRVKEARAWLEQNRGPKGGGKGKSGGKGHPSAAGGGADAEPHAGVVPGARSRALPGQSGRRGAAVSEPRILLA